MSSQYIKTIPYFDRKQVYGAHMTWARSCYIKPTATQQRTLTWLLDTKVAEQKQYVIVNDKPVKSPTKRVLWRRTDTKWVKITK